MSNKFIQSSNETNKLNEIQNTNYKISTFKPEYDGVGFKTDGGMVRDGKKYEAVTIFGNKNAIYTTKTTATAYASTLPNASTFFIYLPPAETLVQLSSTSALDAFGNTRANVITIIGFDGNFNLITDTILMNGLTPVSSTIPFFRVRAMVVQRSGTNSINTPGNAGHIFITPQGDTIDVTGIPNDTTRILCEMAADTGLGTPGVFSIGPTQEIYLSEMVISTSTTQKDSFITLEVFSRDSQGLSGWRSLTKLFVNSSQPVISLHQGGFPNIDYTGGQLGNDLMMVVYRNTVAGAVDTDFKITVYLTAMLVSPS